MTHRRAAVRSGITLTEILIAILILGVGMTSLATLFPLGLLRIQQATRDSRSTLLAESAAAEVNTRSLLDARTLLHPSVPWYSFWTTWNTTAAYRTSDLNGGLADTPFTLDLTFSGGAINTTAATRGVQARIHAPGLPVAYDPSFWSLEHYTSVLEGNERNPGMQLDDLRFGSGIGFIRNAEQYSNQEPSAHGLQRVTNATPYFPANFWPLTYSMPTSYYPNGTTPAPPYSPALAEIVGDVFASPDDPVLQSDDAGVDNGSPLVPADFGGFNFQKTWDFTWMVTARQVSAGDSAVYEADIVLFNKRANGVASVLAPVTGTTRFVPNDEVVVEAVWGYTGSSNSIDAFGYSTGDDHVVLLRWPIAMPDPTIRLGGFIADVTYERIQARSDLGPGDGVQTDRYDPEDGARYGGQRCYWYRVVQVSEPSPDPVYQGYRRRTVRVETPVQAKTRLYVNGSGYVCPQVPEAALINKDVVNVYSTLLYTR